MIEVDFTKGTFSYLPFKQIFDPVKLNGIRVVLLCGALNHFIYYLA